MATPTISSTFGTDAANELAAIAIDLLCSPPADIRTGSTLVSADEVRRGREIMERHDIHWRALKNDAARRARERRAAP